MKTLLRLIVVLLGLTCTPLPIGYSEQSVDDLPCWKTAMTQLALNDCAAQEMKDADAELNKTYARFLSKYGDTPERVDRFRKAQRAWIAFRDADVEALFGPVDREPQASSTPMCRDQALAMLTTGRTKQLKAMLDHHEGDVCGY